MVFPVQFLSRFAVPLTVAAFFMGDIPGQIDMYDKVLKLSDKILSDANNEGEGPTENFDYIVVGGGASGSVVANRLSASGQFSVLLLEAGGDPNPASDLPYIQPYIFGSDMDYNYPTTRQENSCLINDGQCHWPKGKVLGGSSTINGLLYNRCNAKDYDAWANFTGDPIWRHDNVLDAFKAIEDYHGFFEDNPGPNHGIGGEMYVGKISYLPTEEIFFRAIAEKGIPTGDLNTGLFSYGFSKIDYNIKNGVRWGTYQAFLEPILGRPNLSIYRYAQATKIQFDGINRATGVHYTRHGASRYVVANREIIVSGGPVESPKLLMLSGIGPRAHLAEHGIPTLVDLPAVGQHLQEHPGFEVKSFYINQTFGRQELNEDTINEFIQNQTGPASSLLYDFDYIAPQLAHGYITSKQYNDPSWPDIHIYIHERLMNPNSANEQETVFFAVELVRSTSSGNIKLASSDPNDYPLIDPNMLSDPTDLDRIVDGIEFMLDVFFNSTAYRSLGIRWSETDHPITPCTGLGFPSREYWKCYVKQMSLPYWHPTSTCRMGPDSLLGVVDSKLRVFGTSGLRVIDSSAMPYPPIGNTNFPSIMVGEMGSRLILGTQK